MVMTAVGRTLSTRLRIDRVGKAVPPQEMAPVNSSPLRLSHVVRHVTSPSKFCSNQGITRSELCQNLSPLDGRYIVRVAAFQIGELHFCLLKTLKTQTIPIPGHRERVSLRFYMLSAFLRPSALNCGKAKRQQVMGSRPRASTADQTPQACPVLEPMFETHIHMCASRPDGLAALTHTPSHAGHAAAHATHSAHASEEKWLQVAGMLTRR